MLSEKFSWISFYRELANALLKHRNNRSALLSLIYGNPKFATQTTYIHMQDKSPAIDIDPFSFLAIFNRKIKESARKEILQELKSAFSLDAPIPIGFAGIPLLNNQKSFYFQWDNPESVKSSCNDLWELFASILSNNVDGNLFNRVIARKGIGIAMLTIAMFWIRPEDFLPLDKQTRRFLEENDTPTASIETFSDYFSFVQSVKAKMRKNEISEKSFPEISEKAYSGNELPLKKVLVSPERVYTCKLNISKKEWLRVLSHKDLGSGQLDAILKFYMESEHKGSCKSVGERYGIKPSSLNGFVIGFGKFTQRVLNRFRLQDQDGNNYFMIPIKEGKYVGKYFEWTLRDELVEAIEELNLAPKEKSQHMNEQSPYISLLKRAKNLILTGAPGTGNTYLARKIASAMGCSENEIGFVQFHPSYDYTDFVEGLRPTSCAGGNVSFERRDGIFKEFCRKALLAETLKTTGVFEELNDNPTIWKVSLEGTGDNQTRTDCLENGWIRIGWNRYGNVENFDEFKGFNGNPTGKSILRAFQNSIKVGDIVLSCYSAKEIDAVGIVTGEYEYRESGGEYSRYRTVKWIVKNIRADIVALNGGKQMTLSTVYRLSMSIQDIQKIVEKHTKTYVPANSVKPFVFIIDEINRGEIAKIFGELFFSIDPGYRGEKGKVYTQYHNLVPDGDVFSKGFFIPENVYIIGTMNDIDRSVESMDFAMRRRFAWAEISPEDGIGMFETRIPEWREEATKRMRALNSAIAAEPALGSAYQIGPAYFLNLETCNGDFDNLWKLYVAGTLKEYLRGVPDANVILESLKAAYNSATE